MSRRLPLASIALAAVAALALAGCSAGNGGGEKLDPMKSPLQEYMSAIYGNYDQESFDKQQKQIEELVASCMAKEGFEYIPNDNSGGMVISSADDMEDRETREWVAANGYGAAQTPEQMQEQSTESQSYTDPNQDYVASLSESEQAAFYETLYGKGPSEEELNDDGSYEYNWETGGCQGAAQHEIQGEQAYDDEQYKPLFEAMNELYTKVSTQPEMTKLDAEWSSCMADAGYASFKTKFEAAQSIYDKVNKIYEEASTGSENGEWKIDEKAMAALHEEEIELALADFDCAEKTDYTNASLKIQFELERQFIKDNKAELDSLMADYAQDKK